MRVALALHAESLLEVPIVQEFVLVLHVEGTLHRVQALLITKFLTDCNWVPHLDEHLQFRLASFGYAWRDEPLNSLEIVESKFNYVGGMVSVAEAIVLLVGLVFGSGEHVLTRFFLGNKWVPVKQKSQLQTLPVCHSSPANKIQIVKHSI